MTHRWSDPARFYDRTLRHCRNGCGVVKITVHPPHGFPWTEFWRGTDRIETEGTPACEPVRVGA